MPRIDPDTLDTPQSRQMLTELVAAWERFKEDSGLADSPVIRGLEEGRTLAQIQGLSRDDLDVLYAQGYAYLESGKLEKAGLVFAELVRIDPLEPRNHYGLGVTLQNMGRLAAAEGVFTSFLALDATHPAGYLRYGECRLAAGDRADARESFRMAAALCARGHGDEMFAREAQTRMDALDTGDDR